MRSLHLLVVVAIVDLWNFFLEFLSLFSWICDFSFDLKWSHWLIAFSVQIKTEISNEMKKNNNIHAPEWENKWLSGICVVTKSLLNSNVNKSVVTQSGETLKRKKSCIRTMQAKSWVNEIKSSTRLIYINAIAYSY